MSTRHYLDGNEAMVDLEDYTGLKFSWMLTSGMFDNEKLILLESEEIEKLVTYIKELQKELRGRLK